MPTPNEINADDRNTAEGNVEESCTAGAEHQEIVIHAQVLADVWNAALSDPAEAANVVAWLDSKVTR
tara:strand:- start:40 stop:240 length:201 start_codon:yes stop_codon:yes gene_type:complete